jgi:hypothetical protein
VDEVVHFSPCRLFDPQPRQRNDCPPRSAANDGVLVPHPHHRGNQRWKLYQAGIFQNCLVTKLRSLSPSLLVLHLCKTKMKSFPHIHHTKKPATASLHFHPNNISLSNLCYLCILCLEKNYSTAADFSMPYHTQIFKPPTPVKHKQDGANSPASILVSPSGIVCCSKGINFIVP